MEENSQLEFLWNKVKQRAEKLLTHISYTSFIQELEPTNVVNKKLVLKVPTEVSAKTISQHHMDRLCESARTADVGLEGVILVVDGSDIFTLNEQPDAIQESDVVLDKRYTFDSFVVGPGNKFVYAAAKSVAEAPGENFNPLYIYGDTGLGKTHLMQAIANHIAETKPALKVLYTSSEKFFNEYTDSMAAINKGEGREANFRFRNRYRNVDVLIIDDIQFWKSHGVQEAFFNTFNELFARHKQIVISSDCPAKELTTLEERLRTRFEGGLIADIQPPDLETKIAILKRKALEKKYTIIPDDVLLFLARNSDNNVRTLEGRLNKVIFASKLHEEPITLRLAANALQESIGGEEEQEEITPEHIIRATCNHFSITKDELLGKSKRQDLVRARQVCIYLLCDMLSLPQISIGKEMNRDHSTVIYARDKVAELMRVNDVIAKSVTDIRSAVLKQ